MRQREDWGTDGITEAPFWVYTDPDVFDREMTRIFCGRSWSYVGLEAELPDRGDYLVTRIGNRSVIVTRDQDGEIRGFLNRCAHRGVKLCRQARGNSRMFVCPYHQWSYDARGRLKGVPFIKGVKQLGGMPEDFRREDHDLPELAIARRGGVIFASFAPDMPALRTTSAPPTRPTSTGCSTAAGCGCWATPGSSFRATGS